LEIRWIGKVLPLLEHTVSSLVPGIIDRLLERLRDVSGSVFTTGDTSKALKGVRDNVTAIGWYEP
jgi:hypothetical protein